MALDRSKFKPTVVADAIEQDNELKASLGRDGGSYTKYIKIENGQNLLRIYPPHPEEDGGGNTYAEPKVTVWLPFIVVERDQQGNEIIENGRPKLKETSRTVYNSRIHAGTEKDLVEEYQKYCLNYFEEALKYAQDEKEQLSIKGKITQLKGNFQQRINGLNYSNVWVMYVDKIVGQTATFGPVEIKPAVKDRLNSLSASADSGSGAIVTDPFTDIETGRAILVTYNKEAKQAKDYYSTELDNVTIPTMIEGRTYPMPRTFPLSDEQLEAFMKVTPLAKRFKNCFTRRDFNLQFEGLQLFDQKHQIGLFESDEFVQIIEEIDSYYPEIDETAEQGEENHIGGAAQPITAQSHEVIVEEEEAGQDQFDLMTRKELGEWHKKNKTGVLVKPTISDDSLRDLAREFLNAKEEVVAEQEDEQTEEAQQEEEQSAEQVEDAPQQQTTAQTTQSRLEALRNRVGGQK